MSRNQQIAMRWLRYASKDHRTNVLASGRMARGTYDALLRKKVAEVSKTGVMALTKKGKKWLEGYKFDPEATEGATP